MGQISYSQYNQDCYINSVFEGKTTGTYLDLGAFDGLHISNTLFFEQLGWEGMCVEPLPDAFAKLRENRKCECLEGCISALKDEYVEFCQIQGFNHMLSGIVKAYDPAHIHRINSGFQEYKDTYSIIKVRNYRFNEIIQPGLIDYLSLDTEGSELSILKSINWSVYKILSISVENNYGDNKIFTFLDGLGYQYKGRFGCDEIYVLDKDLWP